MEPGFNFVISSIQQCGRSVCMYVTLKQPAKATAQNEMPWDTHLATVLYYTGDPSPPWQADFWAGNPITAISQPPSTVNILASIH